jgi:hypothetical protein
VPPPAPSPGIFGDACELESGNEEGQEKKGEINHCSHLNFKLTSDVISMTTSHRPGGDGTFIAMMIAQEIFCIVMVGVCMPDAVIKEIDGMVCVVSFL